MTILKYDADLEVLVVTKGHPFLRDPFFSLFDSMPDFACTSVEQPAAMRFFDRAMAEPYDAFVLYDMPGIEFRHGADPKLHAPPTAYVRAFEELLQAGQGMVFLHHAIAGWPAWPEYAEIIGGRFHYQPASLRGRAYPDSGYRLAVTHRVSKVAEPHPVTEGIDASFEIEDELYLCPIFEDDVVPLLRSDAGFTDATFYSSARAIQGDLLSREGWSHPTGSNLVGWIKHHGRSPLVYLALGDGPSAYSHPAFKRLLENAIRWVASDEAYQWAARRAAGS